MVLDVIRKVVGGLLLFAAFTFILAGVASPKMGTPEATIPFIVFGIAFGVLGMLLLIKKARIKKRPLFINPYVDVSLYDIGDDFPTVNYFNCNLNEGERLIYATPAQTYVEKEQVVGYSGSSSGVSVRVAKGVTLRSGGGGARAIRDNVLKFNDGDYIITNSRVIFIGQNDSFEFKMNKITAVKPLYKDAFTILSGNKAKNIAVDDSQMKYALGLLNYAIKQTVSV